MVIDTEEEYVARLNHPLYVKIIPPEHNDYTLFKEYEIRIPDDERGDDGPYNYVFEAILVGITESTWGKIPGLLKAYTAKTRDAQEAEQIIHPLGVEGSFDADDELAVLFFLRKDETKKFITTEHDVLVAQNGDIQL